MSKNAIDFKLLAIKPLKDCKKKYCKNLLPGVLYKFYDYYDFHENKAGMITDIERTGSDFNIYDDYLTADQNLKLNVSAIVGKNGSGKSSLMELLYLCAYLVASNNNLLPSNENTGSGRREITNKEQFKSELRLEVYYQVADEFRCIVMNPDFIKQKRPASNIHFYDLFNGDIIPLADFFYTIAINYSIYGLNESIMGPWIGRLFHKNDGYQTPVVINPFRDRGTISIDGEMHFAQTRLLSNIRFDNDEVNEIIPGKGIKEIVFVINRMKMSRFDGHAHERVFEELESSIHKNRMEIFTLIYSEMLNEAPDDATIAKKDWAEMTINYIITKVIRIARNYPEYSEFYDTNSEENVPGIRDLERYMDRLKMDLTHVTLKLRQALNFFRNDPLRLDDVRIKHSKNKITIQADLFAERFELNKKKYPDRDPMEFVPIAPFSPKIILDGEKDFHDLSSGEQQFVHSIQGILYHLLNVDSVFRNRGLNTKTTYNCINIVLDEVELYFHPEFQRSYVSDIIKRISKLNIPNISSINILFLTHSPFILSDIPAVNVLRLEDGHIMEGQLPTFAANIHRMLSSSFFMKSTTGDFAKFQYDEIIKFYEKVRDYTANELKSLNSKNIKKKIPIQPVDEFIALQEEYNRRRDRFVFVIDQIGEQVISGVLKNHIAFIDEKLSFVSTGELSALKKQLEEQLDEVNKKIRLR